ncbi:MAG: carotenoid 1,2-hydratase [Desulfobacteraceae bacterium]|nr:MAG: carotenoid 1,2-hydratase [Desulfobacteraceae bacterium]
MMLLFAAVHLSVTSAMGADEFRSVTGPCNLLFPSDHGSHPCYRTEWWYYTGNLRTASGKRYGFQLTFFRTRIAPPGSEKQWPQKPSKWRAGDLFFAHAALSDLDGKRFFMDEKMARGALGLAGVRQEDEQTKIFIGRWSSEILGDRHLLKADTDQFTLDLRCLDRKGPVAHGLGGCSRKGRKAESSSCYYSVTRLEVGGTLKVRGENAAVEGTAWMDHEFSSAPLEEDVTGWDWFSIQLGDNTELMIYVLRLASGEYSSASSGTFVTSSGEKNHLRSDDFTIEVLERWKSPKSGATYPGKFHIRVPSLKLDLLLTPNLADQELVTAGTTLVTYWEGSVSVEGKSGPSPVTGVGYVELTGYAKPFRLPANDE